MASIADIRKEYRQMALLEEQAAKDPYAQFSSWWEDAIRSELSEVNAMTLATVTAEGLPSARIVLLKDFSAEGFSFYTNYKSRKGMELEKNSNACLVLFWKELERQVRIDGTVEKLSAEASDAYFNSRPAESRIGAIASAQSSEIKSREELEANFKKLKEVYRDKEIPRPEHWGGYIVKHRSIEFWQGRPGRLHDRLLYTRKEPGEWSITRLSP